MGTIRKRKDKYYAEVSVNGQRKGKTFRLRKDAKEWVSETELSLNREGTINKVTVEFILKKYRDTVSSRKKGWQWEEKRINAFLKLDFAKLNSDQINSSDMVLYRDKRLGQVKSSTVNRELNLLSAIFSKARDEWKHLYKNPVQGVKRPKDPPHRDRLYTDKEIELIVLALGYSDEIKLKRHLVAVYFLIAIETAMRMGEICDLRPNMVKGDVAYLVDTKNGDKREVPLSNTASILLRQCFDSGLTSTSKQVSSLFKKYSPIEDGTFHDSRHTAITRLAKKLDVLDLCRMTGHRDIKQIMTYYNEKASDIAKKL